MVNRDILASTFEQSEQSLKVEDFYRLGFFIEETLIAPFLLRTDRLIYIINGWKKFPKAQLIWDNLSVETSNLQGPDQPVHLCSLIGDCYCLHEVSWATCRVQTSLCSYCYCLHEGSVYLKLCIEKTDFIMLIRYAGWSNSWLVIYLKDRFSCFMANMLPFKLASY